MIEVLLPTIVGGIVDVLTSNPEAVEVAKEVAKESPITTTAAMLSVPGIIVEFFLRKIKTKKRRSIFLGIKKVASIVRVALEFTEDAIEYIEKKTDLVCEQRVDDEES